ncbi:MAG: hypothetical protein HHAS10_11090 [Candidatus Altimarinota bacterium]
MEKSVTEKKQIRSLSVKKKATAESLSQDQLLKFEGLIDAIEASGLEEFMEYIRSPWKMLLPNLIAGVARGVGALIGAGIILGLIGWFLSSLISLPLLGKKMEPYVEKIQHEVNKYTETTNYNPHFIRLEDSLSNIANILQEQSNRTPPQVQ